MLVHLSVRQLVSHTKIPGGYVEIQQQYLEIREQLYEVVWMLQKVNL